MNRRRGAAIGLVLGLPVALALTGTASSGCNSTKAALATLAQGCSLNTDCTSPLVCVFSLCHNACVESRDCPNSEICVSVGADNVCELPQESACSGSAPCETGLICVSNQCRDACGTASGEAGIAQCLVAGQSCIQGACYDPGTGPDGGSSGGDGGGMTDSSAPTDGMSSSEATTDAPFVPSPDAGVLGFTPSNFNPAGVDAGDAGPSWAGAQDAMITTACTNCLPVTATTIAMNDGTLADVYVLKSLLISQTASLRLTGTNPVILAVLETVDIQGLLLVNGVSLPPAGAGPGGFASGPNPGPGAGQPPSGAADPDSNGGGGSYCGLGGTAGTQMGAAAAPGMTYGNATLTPLVGGSAGGVVDSLSYAGGAIQIVAGQSITVRSFGGINAGGSGTSNVNGYGGGASGGAILLEAPTVTIDGNLAANGGGAMSGFSSGADATANAQPAPGATPYGGAGSAGTTIDGANGTAGTGADATGGGGGGAGRIRVNTASGSASITGIVSPAMTTACATQGTLN
jgi:hypothetical protein